MTKETLQRVFLNLAWLGAVGGSILYGLNSAVTSDVSEFWTKWEVATLYITIAYTGVVYVAIFFVPPLLIRKLKPWTAGCALLAFGVGVYFLHASAQFAKDKVGGNTAWILSSSESVVEWCVVFHHGLNSDSALSPSVLNSCAHVFALLGAGVAMFIGNALIGFGARPKERDGKTFREIRSAWKYCDIPTVIAFFIITVFISILAHRQPSDNHLLLEFTYNTKAYIGGAVTFQLLFSNFIYGIPFLRWRPSREDQATITNAKA